MEDLLLQSSEAAETEELPLSGQPAALAALLEGATLEEAATRAGVTQRTVSRWRLEPDFQRGLQQARQLAMQEAVTHVHGSLKSSVATLLSLQRDPATPPGVRVRSIQVLFDLADQAQREDLELRLHDAQAKLDTVEQLLGQEYGVTEGKLFDAS